jgi:hypothetical protein
MRTIPPTDPERFERLRLLNPLEAVEAWIDGAFGLGDEPALIEAIRKDFRVTLSDDEIIDIMMEAWDEEWTAPTCFKKLVGR